MKVLFVSLYADPNLVGGNNNVYRQAKALRHTLGVDVEILTWPENDVWSGPLPSVEESAKLEPLEWGYQGLNYHVVKLPRKLLERPLGKNDWQQAVEIGCELLRKINPSIVHLQHWRGLWWILESANRLSIPTVYTPHDWGMCCLRTVLLKGEGCMCDGVVDVEKCAECIWKGRNLLGKANELVVSTVMGERLIEMMAHSSLIERWLSRHYAVRLGLRKRVALNYHRAKSALSNLSAIIVPNSFARDFYRQFGVAGNRIYVEHWYYDLTLPINTGRVDSERIVLGYIGRIHPDKRVDKIFEALSDDSLPNAINLVDAGEIKCEYARQLYSRFRRNVGKHSVEWMGWVPHHSVHQFYQKVDAVIIQSENVENGPLTLIEAFAFKLPVIIPDTPSARDLVREGQTGYFTVFASTESLVNAIRKASLNPNDLLGMKDNTPTIKSSVAYATVVRDIYKSIERERPS